MRKIEFLLFFVFIFIVLTVPACTLPGLEIPGNSTRTPSPTPTSAPPPINPTFSSPPLVTETVTLEIMDFAPIIAKVRPSVVAITTTISGLNIFGGTYTQEGAGSGWIIDAGEGLIVTNNHVVAGATSISVTLEDGRNFLADTVRTDSVTDLAVIRIKADNLPPPLNIGDSSRLKIGNWVIAIGNSLGEGISATKGIISNMGVSVATDQGETLYDLIQTDAPINPGNSGGPLVNLAGEVIGINSIKVAQVGVEGMGYAISSQQALPILNELITVGYIIRPWLGASLYDVNPTVVRQFRLPVDKGVLIYQIVTGGPASQAGLRQYDVITRIDGKEVSSRDALVKSIRSYKVGQTVEITFWRANSENTISVTLGEAPRT